MGMGLNGDERSWKGCRDCGITGYRYIWDGNGAEWNENMVRNVYLRIRPLRM